MKTSHKKLFMFQIIIFLIFILNSFILNFLGGYNFVLFLVLSLIAFKFLFGFERDRNRYTKDIILEFLIFLLMYFILFYILGIFIGFARIENYYTVYGFKTFILPLILMTVLKEMLRYMMIKKSEGSKLIIIMSFLMFTFLDVTEAIYYNGFENSYNTFIFFALSLLPAISSNIMSCYVAQKVGYKPIIFYLLITKLYLYLIPIVPNPNEYISSMINFLLPIILMFKVHSFFEKTKDEELTRDYKKKNVWWLVFPVAFAIIMVYFTSGYFHYHAIAIASGSMETMISKGDVVVIEKIEDERGYDNLEVGQVIAFKYNNIVVVHRLIDIVSDDGQYYYYTKGDANNAPDDYAVTREMIIGVVNIKIPYIGLPTVWLNEM